MQVPGPGPRPLRQGKGGGDGGGGSAAAHPGGTPERPSDPEYNKDLSDPTVSAEGASEENLEVFKRMKGRAGSPLNTFSKGRIDVMTTNQELAAK